MIVPAIRGIGTLELGLLAAIPLLLLWLAVVIWALRDMRRRSRSAWWAAGVLLLVLLLPVVGLLIYLLLRPRETLVEQYERTLRQEALLLQIERGHSCPGCARPVESSWLVCPECHVTLRRPCRQCGTPLEMHWHICPVCAHVVDMPESLASADHDSAADGFVAPGVSMVGTEAE